MPFYFYKGFLDKLEEALRISSCIACLEHNLATIMLPSYINLVGSAYIQTHIYSPFRQLLVGERGLRLYCTIYYCAS